MDFSSSTLHQVIQVITFIMYGALNGDSVIQREGGERLRCMRLPSHGRGAMLPPAAFRGHISESVHLRNPYLPDYNSQSFPGLGGGDTRLSIFLRLVEFASVSMCVSGCTVRHEDFPNEAIWHLAV